MAASSCSAISARSRLAPENHCIGANDDHLTLHDQHCVWSRHLSRIPRGRMSSRRTLSSPELVSSQVISNLSPAIQVGVVRSDHRLQIHVLQRRHLQVLVPAPSLSHAVRTPISIWRVPSGFMCLTFDLTQSICSRGRTGNMARQLAPEGSQSGLTGDGPVGCRGCRRRCPIQHCEVPDLRPTASERLPPYLAASMAAISDPRPASMIFSAPAPELKLARLRQKDRRARGPVPREDRPRGTCVDGEV